MLKYGALLKRGVIVSTVLIQILFFPALALAEETTTVGTPGTDSTASTETVEPAPSTTATLPTPETDTATATTPTPGPTSPSGPSASTYIYNPSTGLWENDYYTWNPVTKQTAPKTSQAYSYNPETGMWDTNEWVYTPEAGKYVPNVTASSAVAPPGYTASASLPANDPAIMNTGPSSNNSIDSSQTNNAAFNLFYNVNISNNVTQSATSGDANVLHNTTGGSATTGDASSIANVLNMLQSSWDPQNGELKAFEANLDGTIFGDLFINPVNLIDGTGPDSSNNISNNDETNLDINAEVNNTINNNIFINSTSGNATVADNTTGGNATTGDAKAVANIINMIGSMISADNSFLGVININGDLNGDFLLPLGMFGNTINGTGPGSSQDITNDQTNTLNANSTENNIINNNVSLLADSGNSSVSGNTTGGSATTGQASTDLNIFNLTGNDVSAQNGMLVFVNVLGNWLGFIMDAPTGSNSILMTGPNSKQSINNSQVNTANINSTVNNTINNNLDLNSTSGDATVSGNTTGGNARTGDATSSANIFNLINSRLEMDDWFGVLFINVFGSWNGSFGVDTDAGDILPSALPNISASAATALPSLLASAVAPPGGNGRASHHYNPTGGGSTSEGVVSPTAASTVNKNAAAAAAKAAKKAATKQKISKKAKHNLMFPLAIVVFGIVFFAFEGKLNTGGHL